MTNNWREEFTEEEVAAIEKYWKVPPPECKGKCQLVDGMTAEGCTGCRYGESFNEGL